MGRQLLSISQPTARHGCNYPRAGGSADVGMLADAERHRLDAAVDEHQADLETRFVQRDVLRRRERPWPIGIAAVFQAQNAALRLPFLFGPGSYPAHSMQWELEPCAVARQLA